jgi:hypothetical protein
MRFQFPDGQVVMLDREFTREGTSYPADWLRKMTPQDREDWGLIELPEPTAPETPATPMVPQVVSARQARLALLQYGLLTTVETAIQSASDAVKIEWEYATEFRRDNALLNGMWTQLGFSKEDLDDVFITAGAIQ